jgi:hypothetical protein
MFCPRCGTIAPSDKGLCGRCGGDLVRPRSTAPEPPPVRAPTNRGEGAQRAAGIDPRPLPKAASRPRPTATEITVDALPVGAPEPDMNEAPAPAAPPPAWPAPASGSRPAPPPSWTPAPAGSSQPSGPPPAWPPPPATWEPAGSGRWAPPEARPSQTDTGAAWGQQPWQQSAQPGWAPPRPPSGWVRPRGSLWDKVFGGQATAEPPTYFWQALVCLFLFLPTGLAAVAYSLMVTKRQQAGDRMGSLRASQLARLWCLISVGVFAVAALVTAAAGLHS